MVDTLTFAGAAVGSAPADFHKTLEAIASKTAEMASVELHALLRGALKMPSVKRGEDAVYSFIPMTQDGKRRGKPREPSTEVLPRSFMGVSLDNRVTASDSTDSAVGPRFLPIDFQLSVNGVLMPRFRHTDTVRVRTVTGAMAPVESLKHVEFTNGKLRLNPSSDGRLMSMIELHPCNVNGILAVASGTTWLKVEVVDCDPFTESSVRRKDFWVRAEGRDNSKLEASMRSGEDMAIGAALLGLPVKALKTIAAACNVTLPPEAIGSPDIKSFLLAGLKSLAESVDGSRKDDRKRLKDLVGGEYRGIEQQVSDAFAAGVLKVVDGEYAIIEGGRESILEGVIIPSSMYGREHTHLAIAISGSDGKADEWLARIIDATRSARARMGDIPDAEEGLPPIKDVVTTLIDADLLKDVKEKSAWCIKNADGTLSELVSYNKTDNYTTRLSRLNKDAERDAVARRLREAAERL